MTTRPAQTKCGSLETLFNAGALGRLTDPELLERFQSDRSAAGQEAFRILLERHGPMVLRLCRSLIPDSHEAEDAFQATFLVLVRKHHAIWVRDSVGPWLYGVACRVARRSRQRSSQRRRSEVALGEHIAEKVTDSRADGPSAEQVIQEEIARLPASLRAPVVLCALEGLTYDAAAQQLGLTEPTLRGRLHRARRRLEARLRDRGIISNFVAPMFKPFRSGGAPLPHALVHSTVQHAAWWSSVSGLVAGESAIPASIAALARGVLRSMLLSTCRMLGIAALLFAGALGTLVSAQQGKPTKPDAKPESGASPPQQTQVQRTPDERYNLLVKEFRETFKKTQVVLADLKNEEERRAFAESDDWPPQNKFAVRFLELAREHPEDPVAFEALAWIVIFGFTAPESDAAAAILARDHMRNPKLWRICQEMSRCPISMARGTLLRAIAQECPDRATRGRAFLALARFLKEESNFVTLLMTPGLRPWQAGFLPEERLAKFRMFAPTPLDREAESVLQQVIREYSAIRPVKPIRAPDLDWDARTVIKQPQDAPTDTGTLAELASSELMELRELAIGKVAPEIDGRDVDGKSFKLSDYRGRVAVLTFSGDWCGPCKAMYPHKREIVQRLAGRPFALLSVSTDAKRETLQKSIRIGEITWRCWWEPKGPDAGIPARWNVRAWPTVYILDHRGVIRLKFSGFIAGPDRFHPDQDEPPIDRFLYILLSECEAERQSLRKP